MQTREDLIRTLLYKADNIKAKIEPDFFRAVASMLKTDRDMLESGLMRDCESCKVVIESAMSGIRNDIPLQKSVPPMLCSEEVTVTQFPLGTTKGDVIQLLFPGCVVNDNFGGAVITNIDGQQFWHKTWWNSPYGEG